MKARISAAAIAGMLMFTTLSGLAPASAGPNRCTKAETVLARAQQSGKAAAIKRAQALVAKYCKPKAPAEPAAPTGTVQPFNLNSRIFRWASPVLSMRVRDGGYYPLSALPSAYVTDHEPGGVDGSVKLEGPQVALAISVPESCTSVTAAVQTSYDLFSKGEHSFGVKLSDAAGTVLGTGESDKMQLEGRKIQPGPSLSVTGVVDPARPTVVILTIDEYGKLHNVLDELTFFVGVSANCSAVPSGQDRVTMTRVSKDADGFTAEARSESQYMDGIWRPTPEGTQAFFNEAPVRVGPAGALTAGSGSTSNGGNAKRFSVGTAFSRDVQCTPTRCVVAK